MTRNEVLKKINDAFKDFEFFEEDHHYECKGKRVGVSVTRFIEQYCNPFDKNIAYYIAKRDGKEVQEVLDEWEHKNLVSCEKGHFGHLYVQNLWSGIEYLENIKSGLEDAKKPLELIKKHALHFKSDFEELLEHVSDEIIIGSEEYDIASAIDHLFINKITEGLILVDYKTNSFLSGYNKKAYKKPMKPPLHHLNDDSLNHYYIQLSIYRYFLEKYAKLEVEKMLIVYLSENEKDYKIIEVPYLKNEVEQILEWRLLE